MVSFCVRIMESSTCYRATLYFDVALCAFPPVWCCTKSVILSIVIPCKTVVMMHELWYQLDNDNMMAWSS